MADSLSRRRTRTASAGAPGPDNDVTRLLVEWQNGDTASLEQLLRVVDHQLRGLARAALRGEAPGHTLQTTALINEAYLRLVGRDRSWEGSRHFMDVAARAMRRVLVDYARRRRSQKRGSGRPPVGLDTIEPLLAANERTSDLVDL